MPPLIFVLLFCIRIIRSASVNITIDDTFGDAVTGEQFVYTPDNLWNAGQTCSVCTAKLDTTRVQNGTWHDSTFFSQAGGGADSNVPTTASVTFFGTALYVYCVLAHTSFPLDGNIDMTFSIDGEAVGTFVEAPDGDPNFSYNDSVFSIQGLSLGQHNFTLTNGHVNGNTSLVLLDYAIYTTILDGGESSSNSTLPSSTSANSTSISGSTPSIPSGTSASSQFTPGGDHATNTAAHHRTVAMAVVISLIGVLMLIAGAFFLYRRRRVNAIRDDSLLPLSFLIIGDGSQTTQAEPSVSSQTWPPPPVYKERASHRWNVSRTRRPDVAPGAFTLPPSYSALHSYEPPSIAQYEGRTPRAVPAKTIDELIGMMARNPSIHRRSQTTTIEVAARPFPQPARHSTSDDTHIAVTGPLLAEVNNATAIHDPLVARPTLMIPRSASAIGDHLVSASGLTTPISVDGGAQRDWISPATPTPFLPARADSVRTVLSIRKRLPDVPAVEEAQDEGLEQERLIVQSRPLPALPNGETK